MMSVETLKKSCLWSDLQFAALVLHAAVQVEVGHHVGAWRVCDVEHWRVVTENVTHLLPVNVNEALTVACEDI